MTTPTEITPASARSEPEPPSGIRAIIGRNVRQSIAAGTTTVADTTTAGLSWDQVAEAPLRAVVFAELIGLKRSRGLGFACTACIHPLHVPIINEEYGVSAADADRARRLLAAFDTAVAAGQGAVAFEGAMIDLPVAERARRLLARVR